MARGRGHGRRGCRFPGSQNRKRALNSSLTIFKGIPFSSLLKCRLLDDKIQGWSGDEVMGDEDVVFQEVKIEKGLQILP